MSQAKILIIEDEAAIRDMLKFTLTASDYDVAEASNAEDGWKLALDNTPDIILLDWIISGFDKLVRTRLVNLFDRLFPKRMSFMAIYC
mgnify:CR=1 FL=1